MIELLVMGFILVVGLALGLVFFLAKLAVLAVAIPLKLLGVLGGLVAAVIACAVVLTLGVVLIPFILLFAVPLALLGGLVWLLMP